MCDWAQAVLDDDTGDLLEYRKLIKNPKYKEVWSNSFAKEIHRLADTTKTIAFVSKHQIPQGRQKDITYGRLWNTNGRSTNGQNPTQQHSINNGRKIYDH
jgi:hypothetical protein